MADTAKPTAEAGFLASGDTTTAALALANPDMLTAEEFLEIPHLEDAQARNDEDREESPASFDATSLWAPELPTPKESLPPEKMDCLPTKKSKRSKKGGRSGRH